jgi:catechol 2,3-dioxygenase-like lactoylglutathione lyase family enzyme
MRGGSFRVWKALKESVFASANASVCTERRVSALISGLSHMTFIAKDLAKAAMFFTEVLGAKEVYSSGDRTFSLSKEKFFLVGDIWLCAMEGESLGERTYNHIAFRIQDHEFDEYLQRINRMGLEIRPQRPRVEGEGRSIYFYDFDNHLFELHTGTLKERLERYAGAEEA